MKDLADSVLACLRNFAKARNLIYNEGLMRYILERIFYRTIPVNPPVIFTPDFHESKLKQKQWTAFLRKSRLDVGDKSLSDIIAEIAEFLMPLLKKCRSSDI